MPDRSHRGSDLNLAWQAPPWANSGETVDATEREEPGQERTSELDTERALDRLDALEDREGRGDGDGQDADEALESATALFAEVVATSGAAEARARLLRPVSGREGRA
jgi:hypothetical protein